MIFEGFFTRSKRFSQDLGTQLAITSTAQQSAAGEALTKARAKRSWLSLRRGLLAALIVAAPAQADYSEHPGAQALIDEMVAEHGFSKEELQSIFVGAERQQSILDAISRPAEKTKPWYEYREIFLTERREREGVEFFREHREALSRAQAETGVPAEVIVAIIGVETYYGRIAGSYDVIDALSTLAFDYPKRSKFFTSELKNFLLLSREQGMDPMSLKGSYAGAMGYGQFMPSSYRAYAIDFDGDELADIWSNPTDAIGSVANYLAKHGWRAGEPVVSAAIAAETTPEDAYGGGLKPTRSVGAFMEMGVSPEQQLDPEAMATFMRFELADGYEYWMGLQNLYVITRYNHSAMYAMSVFLLSQQIAAGVQG